MTAMPAEQATAAAVRPTLRLVAAPASAPLYDDEPGPRTPLRLVAPLEGLPKALPFDDDAWLASSRTPTAQLPAAQDFARVLLQGVVEVLAGVRPLKQLQRDTTLELYARLSEALSARPVPRGNRPALQAVRSLHVQARPEGVAEVCATIRRGSQLVALALRLEGQDGRWRCTDLIGV